MEATTIRRSISLRSLSELPNETLQRISKNFNVSERGKLIKTNSEITEAIDKKIHVDYTLSRDIFEQITALASGKHPLTDEQFDKLLHHKNPKVIEKLCSYRHILTPARIDKILNIDNINAHRAIAQNNYPLTGEQFDKLMTDTISSMHIAESRRMLSEQQIDKLAKHRSPMVIEKLIFSSHPLTEKHIDNFVKHRNYLIPLRLAESNRPLSNKQFKILINHKERDVRNVFGRIGKQFVERKLTSRQKRILLASQLKKAITFGLIK